MTYKWKDIKEAGLGAVVASLLFALIRSGNPIDINPFTGLIVGLIWIYIVTRPFITKKRETYYHAIGNIIVTLVITITLSLVFNLVEVEQLKSFQFFGTTPWVMVLLSLPAATFFNRFNITNIYTRWYHRNIRGR